jgi:hypothetical protein
MWTSFIALSSWQFREVTRIESSVIQMNAHNYWLVLEKLFCSENTSTSSIISSLFNATTTLQCLTRLFDICVCMWNDFSFSEMESRCLIVIVVDVLYRCLIFMLSLTRQCITRTMTTIFHRRPSWKHGNPHNRYGTSTTTYTTTYFQGWSRMEWPGIRPIRRPFHRTVPWDANRVKVTPTRRRHRRESHRGSSFS